MAQKKICVILPCLNEEKAIANVVQGFIEHVENCTVYVFDNNSTDNTIEEAQSAGALTRVVKMKGKGNVVQAMFRDVDADIYILADGDGTYPAKEAREMVNQLMLHDADLVIGSRLGTYKNSQSRKKHFLGNLLLTNTVNKLFATEAYDLLSGYRVMSRRYVKTMPLFSKGFEVETAMTIHAIEVGAKIIEHPINYLPRIEGTESKLNTWQDGFKIGKEIFQLYKDYAPKVVYFILAISFILIGFFIGIPVVIEYIYTGLVPKFPRAILASALVTIGIFTAFIGIVLSSISKLRREMKKLAFLSIN
ncbi:MULTISPECIES: glycosyltransferase [Acinetobacter]|uniref:Glycosyltransferase n=1 Tax=Acinetobacter chengduensis TaxID=2420890 RepID=A0ABX9TVB6_9GAMM|nr:MULTISPECIES: glycosyltransferase [Acinetobacter]MBI1451853.1 glycosyltransferase [Acinetobacter sp. FL51]RKG44188.1 glycosyltransferase [Acinetobacter sp. WCHAc060007]RLL21523.1 glycosyltransferase [Acinetobacter chengduensis]